MPAKPFVWRQLHWPTPLDPERLTTLLRVWSTDVVSQEIVLETRATATGVRWLLGARVDFLPRLLDPARDLIPGLSAVEASAPREDIQTCRRLSISTRHRPLHDDPVAVTRAVFSALHRARPDEEVVLQLVLGPRRKPAVIPNEVPSSYVRPLWQNVFSQPGANLDTEKRQALRAKHAAHGFACTIRLGVRATRVDRRKSHLLGLYGALRSVEDTGTHLRLMNELPHRLNQPRTPWIWPLVMNTIELTSLSGLPLGDDDLPGLPAAHPRLLAPDRVAKEGDRIIAAATAPGVTGNLGYSVADSTRHSWFLGPNGTGKTTALLNLITQDMAAGRAMVVVEPKDLVSEVLARVPANRRDDVVLLDASDPESVVGFNPLASAGRSPDLVADTILGVFHALYADSWGPRTQDVLHNALLTLARRDDASLIMLPLLLTNPAFRRSMTKTAMQDDRFATGPFWAAFEALSDAERAQVIAPAMNKLRPWLIRPSLRAVLAQQQPRFNVRQVLTENKILLVPLSKGTLGPEGAQLLGAMVLSELWQAIRERVTVPVDERTPVMVYIDEVQDFLRLPTDLADVLATSRSLGASFHVAHQYRDQLSPNMRSAFETNARSRIAFQLSAADAKAMAAGQTELTPNDFSALGAFEIYTQLMHDGHLTGWASGKTLPPPPTTSSPKDVRAASRANYGRPVAEIEASFAELLDQPPQAPTKAPGRLPRRDA
jgi:hypothetical protein